MMGRMTTEIYPADSGDASRVENPAPSPVPGLPHILEGDGGPGSLLGEWLRARVEKLEEKGSRDQLLLLSETQTIKALITIQEQRRSPVRLALEWLGFITPPSVDTQPPRSAIDVTLGSESPKR
jgi:hypothetical protein